MSKLRKKFDIERRRSVHDSDDFAAWFSKRPFTEGATFEISCPSEMPPVRLDRVIRESIEEFSWSRSRALIENGKTSVDGEIVRDIARLVRGGSVVRVDPAARKPQNQLSELVRLVYWDSQLVVVNKPSGVSTVPFDEHETDTLDELTRRALGKVLSTRLPSLGVVHRIDKDTSGIVVFARTTVAKRHLKQQFRFHTNSRIYFALVLGQPRSERIESRLIDDRGDGRRGSTTHPTLGQNAITYVDVIEAFKTASLVRCRLETGRTHQIRIHLSERGHPILGDRVYGRSIVESVPAVPRLMLHAMELGFDHPTRDERMSFRADLPEDFVRVLENLKKA
jgi:23S rRNA pseudouridine1911/1915/1917 synthase